MVKLGDLGNSTFSIDLKYLYDYSLLHTIDMTVMNDGYSKVRAHGVHIRAPEVWRGVGLLS